ncbi:MAG: cadherin domain-containing protein [Labilibaculum antarcticum]
MKKRSTLLISFLFFMCLAFSSQAQQYTLTDDDVVVTDGVIMSCSYDFTSKDIIIPEMLDGQTVTEIWGDPGVTGSVFRDKGINSVQLPESLLKIGRYVFYRNNLSEIIIPSSVTTLGQGAFYGNQLTSIHIPDGIAELPLQVFHDNQLTSLVIPEGVVSIGGSAFSYNQLTSVSLPSSVCQIEGGAFESNSALSSITLPTVSISGQTFLNWIDGDGNTYANGVVVNDLSVSYSAQFLYTLTDDDVVVTDGVIESCSYDFTSKDIIIPETLDGQTVTEISTKDMNNGVFMDNGILSVIIPNTITKIGNNAFRENEISSVIIPSSVAELGSSVFTYNSLTSITIPESITEIKSWTFYGNNDLSEVSFPDGLSSIGDNAFCNCYDLAEVNFPNTVSYIGTNAFGNIELESFILPSPEKEGYTAIWTDSNEVEYASGDEVTDKTVSYTLTFEINNYEISGTVNGADDVTITLSGDASDTKVLNNGKTYSFPLVEYDKSVVLTAEKIGYYFETKEYAFPNIYGDKTEIDFQAIEHASEISNNSIAENSVIGSEIGTLSAKAGAANQPYIFSMTENEYFGLEDDKLVSKIEFNYEDQSTYYLEITVTDQEGTIVDEPFTIQVEDVNDIPSEIQLAANTIAENSSIGTEIGTVTATDQDAGTTFSSWTIVSGNDDAVFTIDAVTGEITIADNAKLDFETTETYALGITVSDGENASLVETVNIIVNDINEVPIVTASQTFSVNENAANTTSAGAVMVNDQDAGTTFSSWTIVSGNEDVVFAINAATGELTIADNTNLDFETTETYALGITVSDGENTSLVETVSITVNDINDNTPIVSASQIFSVNEDAANTTSVGAVMVNDQDAGTTFSSWTIVSGNDDAVFVINAATGELTIADNTKLDFETTETYALGITASDGENTSLVETVNIIVNDINEVPIVTASQTFSVNENAANTTSAGAVMVNDQDAGTTFSSWTIVSGNEDVVFAINAATGELTIADNTNLDFETTETYALGITVSDGENTSLVETVSITVNDINDNTPIVSASQIFSVNEDAANTTSVGAVMVNDQDAGTTFSSWTIVSGNDDAVFVINAATGELTIADNTKLDFETKEAYALGITVSDGENTSLVETVSITVNDINDNTPIVSASQIFSVNEDAANTTSVGAVMVNDQDAGTTFSSWTIVSGNDDAVFVINAATGELTIADNTKLDFETTETYALGITVSDGENTSLVETVNIAVNDINEAPTAIQLSANTIAENVDAGTQIGALTATDVDANQTFTYTIVENENFEIAGDKLISKVAFDFEKKDSYAIDIKVEDQDGLSYTQELKINIENLFDLEDFLPLETNISIDEKAPVETVYIGFSIIGYDNADCTYEIVSSNFSPCPFEIRENKLYANRVLSAWCDTPWSGDIKVRTNDGKLLTKRYYVKLNNLPDPPRIVNFRDLSIDEDIEIGTDIAPYFWVNSDCHDPAKLSMLDNEYFEIIDDKICTKSKLDFQENPFFELLLTVKGEESGLSTSYNLHVAINDVNDAPTAISLSNASIAVNSFSGVEIGTLSASDVNADQTFIYSIAENEFFEIVGDKLVSKASFDFETLDNYSVEITVTDQDGLTHKQSFSIDVIANDYLLTIVSSEFSVEENSPRGTFVGQIVIEDQDEQSNNVEYALNSYGFAIDKATGEITVSYSYALNFEEDDDISLTVLVSDYNHVVSKEITITIVDVNEAPYDLELSGNTVLLDAEVGAEVGIFSATDVDNDDVISYSIAENEFFEVIENKLIVKSVIVYEEGKSYTVSITATDQGDFTTSRDFTIYLQSIYDENNDGYHDGDVAVLKQILSDNPNSSLTWTFGDQVNCSGVYWTTVNRIKRIYKLSLDNKNLQKLDVSELERLRYLYRRNNELSFSQLESSLELSNLDRNYYSPQYKIFEQQVLDLAGSSSIEIDYNTEKLIDGVETVFTWYKDREIIEGENSETYTPVDAGIYYCQMTNASFSGLTLTTENAIVLTTNNYAPVIVSTSFSVNENSANGTILGQIGLEDEDEPGNTVEYSLTSNYFTIDSYTGEISLAGSSLNYEEETEQTLSVSINDYKHDIVSKDIIVTINDVNEAPYDLELSGNTVLLDAEVGAEVGIFSATDVDNDDVISYSIAENEFFEVIENKLIVKSVIVYEEGKSYTVSITATDQGDFTTSRDFTIYLQSIYDENNDGYHDGDVAVLKQILSDNPNSSLTWTFGDQVNCSGVYWTTVNRIKRIYKLSLDNKNLQKLDVSELERLRYLYCRDNQLPFSQLETTLGLNIDRSDFIYSHQNKIFEEQVLDLGSEIDYSSENLIDGVETAFIWYKDGEIIEGENSEKYTPVDAGIYYCQMTNASFSRLTLTTENTIVMNTNTYAPVIASTNFSVDENSVNGTLVGQIVIEDEDEKSSLLHFSIADETQIFAISEETGKITVQNYQNLDYNLYQTIPVELSVYDYKHDTITKSISIAIVNINEAPSELSLIRNTIDEDFETGTQLGVLSAIDDDIDEVITYSVDENDYLYVEGDKVLLKSVTDQTVKIRFTATDQRGASISKKFTFETFSIEDKNMDGFHDGDLAKIKQILIDNPDNTLGWTGEDYANWYGLDWNDSSPRRIEEIYVEDENLVQLNVSGCSSLEDLDCYDNQLTSLDISGCTSLEDLECDDNQLTSLDVSGCTSLEDLECDNNQLTSLDVSGCTSLGDLECDNNQLTSLDVSGCTSLEDLDCEDNQLTSLDVSGCTSLEDLDCEDNHLPLSQLEQTLSLSLSRFYYGQNEIFDGREINLGTEIDFSSEQTIGGTETSFEWFKDGNQIANANSEKFTPTETGVYYCEMENDQFSSHTFVTNTITVIEANSYPTSILANQLFTIEENSAMGSEVGQVLTKDDDPTADALTFSIKSNVFDIEASTGKLLVKDSQILDFEKTESFTAIVTVDDGKHPATSESISINLLDVNEVPTAISLSNATIAENSAIGTEVGTLSASDIDADQTFTYTIAENEFFELIGDKLVSKSDFDYEANNSYPVEITVADQAGLTYKQNFSIEITDENEAPTAISLSNATIAENSAIGTEVGILTATDQDAGQTLTFTIAENEFFELVGDQLVSKSDFDYEANNSYSVEITVADQGGLTYKQDFSIQIEDVNEVPTAIQLSNATIAENSAIGSEVGILTATDQDAAQTLTFTIAENEFFELAGDQLVSKLEFDYEANNSYSVEITVADQGGLTYKQDFSIQIEDVNEVPTAIQLSNATIAENSAIGSEVGILTATDQDAAQTLTFTIEENEFFALAGDQLVSKSDFDYEADNSYSVEITVADQAGLTYKQSFSIQITDENETPSAIQLSNATITENLAIGTEVGTLSVSDEDADQTFTYTIAENEFFELAGDKLVSKSDFDFETKDSYSVEVTVADQAGLNSTQNFTIQIENRNEAPEFVSDPFVDAILNERYTYTIEYQDVDVDGCIVTAFEMPSWLIFEDNGDGTATLSGIPTEAGTFNVILEASDNEYTARQEFELVVETVTGIEDVVTAPIVRIYPNPVLRELHIDLSEFRNDATTISLFSMTGSLIFKEEHQNVGGELRIIKSVQQLRSGVYLLLIESKGYRKSYKIVKQ